MVNDLNHFSYFAFNIPNSNVLLKLYYALHSLGFPSEQHLKQNYPINSFNIAIRCKRRCGVPYASKESCKRTGPIFIVVNVNSS